LEFLSTRTMSESTSTALKPCLIFTKPRSSSKNCNHCPTWTPFAPLITTK
jgi:hypothetical protein